MRLRFLSSNPNKIAEAKAILTDAGHELAAVRTKLDEMQSDDVELLVRDKTIRAFRLIGRPVFVEHTGLFIDALNGFPGGLTQIFWDRLGADRIARLFSREDGGRAVARTRIGYCDGRCVHQFEGEVRGRLAPEPRGDRSQWDCIFILEGSNQTFAEMGERKNEVSMRRKALECFAAFLSEADDD
ncbi:MAG TPA: non-canonical purine NTP pyrophosphatase [Beijerinckiaceae bacterium]|nr:non-canonical purine NTP pyrophosphatase [Beijerinckiaceae bacterium]